LSNRQSSSELSRTYAETNLGVLPKEAQAPTYMQWGVADYANTARAIVSHAANCMRDRTSRDFATQRTEIKYTPKIRWGYITNN